MGVLTHGSGIFNPESAARRNRVENSRKLTASLASRTRFLQKNQQTAYKNAMLEHLYNGAQLFI